MSERRPLVLVDGLLQEMPAGDTISTAIAPGSGGGGGGGEDPYPSGNQGPTTLSYFTDLTNTTPYNGIWIDNNSNGSLTFQSVTGRPGVIRLSTGSNAAGRRHITTNANAIIPQAGQVLRFKSAIRVVDAVPDATNDYQCIIGFFTQFTTGQSTNVACFVYDRLSKSSGGLLGVAACNANSGNLIYQGVAPTLIVTDFNVFEVVIDGLDSITFLINGTQVYQTTASTAFPAALMQHGVGIRKIAGTTGRSMDVDWLAFQSSFPTRS